MSLLVDPPAPNVEAELASHGRGWVVDATMWIEEAVFLNFLANEVSIVLPHFTFTTVSYLNSIMAYYPFGLASR